MPITKRKQLLRWANLAIDLCNTLDAYLAQMDELASGRQPAIPEAIPLMLEAHNIVRELWRDLERKL